MSDNIRVYLTGVVVAEDPQIDPNLSLGNLKSSNEVEGMHVSVTNPIWGVKVLYASSSNGIGVSNILAAAVNDELQYSAPGDDYGTAVVIANGETKTLYSLDTTKWVRVIRDTSNALTGSMRLTLSYGMNNLFDDSTVSGEEDYRCIAVTNDSDTLVSNVEMWCDDTEIKLGLDPIAAGPAFDTSGRDDNTVPVGVVFLYYDGTPNNPWNNITIVNPGFDTDLSGWSITEGWEWSGTGGGAAVLNNATGVLYQSLAITAGVQYRLTVSSGITSGTIAVGLGDTAGVDLDGTIGQQQLIIATNTDPLGFIASSAALAGIDDIVVEWQSANVGRLTVGNIAAGDTVYVWVKRTIANGIDATPYNQLNLGWSEDGSLGFQYRVEDSTLEGYELYRGTGGSSPDFDAAPYETFSTLPHTIPQQSPSDTYSFVTRFRNSFDIVSKNIAEFNIILDGNGDEVTPDPSPVEQLVVSPSVDGKVIVTAIYNSALDGLFPATSFNIYITDTGVDPDTGVDSPTNVAVGGGTLKRLSWTSTTEYAESADIRVIVTTLRGSSESIDSAVVTTTASATGPVAPDLQSYIWSGIPTLVWEHDSTTYIYWYPLIGLFRFVIDGVSIAGIGASRTMGIKTLVETPLDANTQTEVIEYNVTNNSIIVAGGTTLSTLMEVFPDGTLQVASAVEDPTYPKVIGSFTTDPVELRATSTDFSVDLSLTVMKLLDSGVLTALRFVEDSP